MNESNENVVIIAALFIFSIILLFPSAIGVVEKSRVTINDVINI